jgi:hypothetical protein
MIFLKDLLKLLQNRVFSVWASRSGFGAAISVAAVRNSVVFYNSAFADRTGMAAARFLAAAAACVILLGFAAENRKLYCSGCMKVANGALAADFFHFEADDFPFQIPFKKCFKIVVFLLVCRDHPVLELQFV